MEVLLKTILFISILYSFPTTCESAKINTPRVLLPWFENLYMNFTFEIIEGGCYTWSLSRDDIIDLEPLYEDTWGHCSRAARVSVSKACAPPGSVIILAEEVNTGEILRGDVDIDKIKSLKVMSTTWKLYLEEAPEAFEVIAYDDQGNKFSTLEGLTFVWSIENLGSNIGEDPLVTLVRWRDTDYEAPRGIAELEASGLRSHSVLLYGQAMGESRVIVCLEDICTDFTLQVVASVVLTPATAIVAPSDTLRYRVVRARAGRLTIQDVADTLYHMKVPDSSIALLEDNISLVRANKIGTTTVQLMSGSTEVATATLTIAEPHSIRVTLRPTNLLIKGEVFLVHCIVLDKQGHALTAGDEMLIRLTAEGEANVDLLRSTENGTLTDAIANDAGELTITARLHSVAGKTLSRKVEGQVSAEAVEPLEIVPPELFVAWTDTVQDIQLNHRGGGEEPVTWEASETPTHSLSLAPTGVVTVRGVGDMSVRVQLKKYSHVQATGRVWSAYPELIQVSSTGHARVGRPHHLHVALTATHPVSGELYNFHTTRASGQATSSTRRADRHASSLWGTVQLSHVSHATVNIELIQVSSTGHARVGRPHHLHVALTATHPVSGELYNFHTCNCGSFAVSLLEGPEPHNVTAAPWVEPIEGACCVLECAWRSRGVSTLRVSRGRAGDTCRVAVRAAPRLVWPQHAAALHGATLPTCCVLECAWRSRGVSTLRVSRGRAGDTCRVAVRAAPRLVWPQHAAALHGATLPVLAEGETLEPHTSDGRVAELLNREGPPPHRYPDVQLFTLSCRRKGDARLQLSSFSEEERESVDIETACAPYVSRIRLEPSETPGNCSGGAKVWLRPGHEVTVKVTLLDAIGRELLDERGPKVSWEIEPNHVSIEYKALDRLLVEMNPEYAPVPVPHKYYQVVVAEEQAIGWSGQLKASIPDATASIQAKVVGPLKVEPLKVNIAWEGESVANIATITGGSGRYNVETGTGVTGAVERGALSAAVPGPGAYDLTVTDACVGDKQVVEVNIEEILSVEVSTSRAVCVDACVPITALVKGISHRYLTSSRAPEWRVAGQVVVRDGKVCGVKEGAGRVRAALGGVWSPEVEILVFPPLEIIPSKARLPAGARLQLRHRGGPPSHLAALTYRAVTGINYVEVSQTGALQGLALGTTKIKLVATDISNVEMASAESEVEVIPITGLRVRAATQTLLVGSPSPVWVEAVGLATSSLATLHPAPRVTFSVRDPTAARLYTTHADDFLERPIAEGLSVRVVPLKPGLITMDVRVRNMGQVAETRSWDSTIEILALSDIRTAVDGLPNDLTSGDRLAIAAGSTIRLKSLPRSDWKAYSDGSFDVTSSGEVNALKPGHGVLIGYHKDERNNVYRETAIHVEVSLPHYCTAEPSDSEDEAGVRLVLRNNVGRRLIAPGANVSVLEPLPAHNRRATHSALGDELIIAGLDSTGAFITFQSTASGVTVKDEVWVTGVDLRADRVLATGGWAICLEGVGWRAPPGVSIYAGSGVSLAVLTRDASAKHVLRMDRSTNTYTVLQTPIQKMEFLPGEWPSSMVPLAIESSGLSSGPVLCAEDQKYALEGVQVELPFICRTKAPYSAEPVLDINNDRLGCSVITPSPITDASEVELCAEWESYRTCTKVLLLPPVKVSHTKVSLLDPLTMFTISGHPQALKSVKMSISPGLKIETNTKDGEIIVIVKSESLACGLGWVNVRSKLTAQEFRVEVEKECDVACGTLLGAMFAIVRPYLTTLMTIAAVAAGILFLQAKFQKKSYIGLRNESPQTVLPPETTPPMNRTRTWSRSPYASNGPTAPVYGDASVLPDNSFSPNTTRMHSRFL